MDRIDTLHSGCLLPSAGLSDGENYYNACSGAFRGKDGEVYQVTFRACENGLMDHFHFHKDPGESKFMSNQFQGSETLLAEPFNFVKPRPQTQKPKNPKPRGLGLTLKYMGHPKIKMPAFRVGRQIQCRKDQMQVSHVENSWWNSLALSLKVNL